MKGEILAHSPLFVEYQIREHWCNSRSCGCRRRRRRGNVAVNERAALHDLESDEIEPSYTIVILARASRLYRSQVPAPVSLGTRMLPPNPAKLMGRYW